MPVRSALQINMHPLDARHVEHVLPHQLRVWGGQVERVSLTVDTQRSRNGRYRGEAYEESRAQLFKQIEAIARGNSKVSIDEVDYSAAARESVRRRYFGALTDYPDKAFDGGPFHAYFYGLLKADADYVVHMDSDMLFGGADPGWLAQATQLLRATSDALFAGPLPGPPRADGSLADRHRSLPGMAPLPPPTRLAAPYPAYRFQSVSTRIFVLDERKFATRLGSLELVRPDLKRRLRAWAFRQSSLTMPAEEALSAAMARRSLFRVDFLGSGAGMFSLHPPYRSETFYRELPALIARIERGDLPEAQRGDYDVNASLMDWSEALRQRTRGRRALRALRGLVAT